MKDHLIFDVTDANTILDSDSVGAFVRAGTDGDLIGSQTVNSQEWLNVASVLYDEAGSAISDANPLAVSVKDGINVEVDLSHVDDSVALGDGTNLLTSTTVGADIGLDVNLINSSIAVTGTDFDIRDITHVSDSIALGNGTSLLTSTTVGSDIGLDVYVLNDPATSNTAILSTASDLTAAGTAEKIVATNLANRKEAFIYNFDNRKVYIGGSAVDKDNGFPISPGSYMELKVGAAVDVYYDSEKSGHQIRVLEIS